MTEQDWLAKQFQEKRSHLRAVATRILGSTTEADDAVQEAWLRLTRSDANQIENLGGWLNTVVARVCLDMLRARKTRKAEPIHDDILETPQAAHIPNPAEEALLADTVGSALLIVLRTLTPAERVSFVMHDLFNLSFEEIAPILGRSEMAVRQLASRARRRVQGQTESPEDRAKKQQVVAAFLAASREGNLNGLLQVLNPGIQLYADDRAVKTAAANNGKGAPQFQNEMAGSSAIAETFNGNATALQLALINGTVGAAWFYNGKAMVAFLFSTEKDRIQEINVVMEPEDLEAMKVEPLN